MSITPASVRARFDVSDGLDPLFRTNDGSNSPQADVSTVEARRAAYSLLLSRGLIRVELTVPPGAEFIVESVDDPYGFATPTRLSLFRRPLPAVNTAFLTTVMWDGRETFDGESVRFALARQANNATLGHAQATQALAPEQQAAIVDLETALFSAQIFDPRAGDLADADAAGGPQALADGLFPLAADRNWAFTLFTLWADLPLFESDGAVMKFIVRNFARRNISLGQDFFNNRTLSSSGLTCSSCHNTPNVGSNFNGLFFDTGVANLGKFRPRDPKLPLYTLRCLTTNTVVRTSDPGRALVTGRCEDIGRFKVPTLRGLAARAPYFHDGSASTIDAVILFYENLFLTQFGTREKMWLQDFLSAL